MSEPIEGKLTVVVHAGYLEKTGAQPGRIVGQQLTMAGLSGLVYITPDVARQWIGVLESIAGAGE